MKIFISYSRNDAGDFANQIHRHLSSFNYDIFTDVDSIRAGEVWSNTIEENISNCDIFVVIVTNGALRSPYVEREVLLAQMKKKLIIPCIYRNVESKKIEWGLNRIQGIEFENKFELSRNLNVKISQNIANRINKNKSEESIDIISSYSPNWYLKRANKFKEIGKYKEAAEMYGELLKLQPENLDAWREKGLCLIKIGEFKDALKAYEEALQIDPNNVDGLVNKGYILATAGHYEKAIEFFDKATDIDPNNVDAWYEKGNSYSRIGRQKEAKKFFKIADNLKRK